MNNFLRIAGILICVAFIGACASSAEDIAAEKNARKRIEIHTHLAATYLQRNQLDVASEEVDRALELDSNDSQANNIMALLQARMRDDAKAERYFRKSIAVQPDNSEAQNNYGVFLCERARLDEAEQRFKYALINPLYKTPELANLNAGVCLLKKPDPVGAARYFKAALEINPKIPLALYHMAKISYDSGKFLSARGFMQRYFEVAPDGPETLLLASRIERALKAKDAAASYALRLRSKYPDSNEAKQLRELTGK